MLLRSRIVLPVSQPPIEDGAVRISGNRITGVGPWTTFAAEQSEVIDLGESILLPGLINSHCHLDYTGMAGLVPPQKSFVDWITLMLSAKSDWNYSEYAESWIRGAKMLLHSGTTTVADIEAVPELIPDVWTATPLRVISMFEMTGVKSRRSPRAILQETIDRIETLPGGQCRVGLSPHAPYSTAPELIRLSAESARRHHWPIAIHVSESVQEFEMFTAGKGKMHDWLRRNGRDMSDCKSGSPIQQLERNDALSSSLLAVHVNYLSEKDAGLLGKRKTNVVHCPRSHAYFRHAKFPLGKLIRSKVNVCLGTDSLATVIKTRRATVELNMFQEMRTFAASNPRVPARAILQMATVNGARALGMAGECGEISERTLADLIAIPFSGDASDAYKAVLHHRGPVTASLIDGQWAIAPKL